MRMFPFSSWISESKGSKELANGEVPIKMTDVPTSLAVESGGVAKRKRECDEDAEEVREESTREAKRRKQETTGLDVNPEHDQESFTLDVANPDNLGAACTEKERRLRDMIDSQMSLEILLKHDELRLIDQELAKCQTALEQLRRCHLIPFPIAQGDQMENISNGTGPALIPRNTEVRPQWAPPYGVTDGPYSRHYAKWLIPDPSFDGIQPDWERGISTRAGKSVQEGRATRNSFADASTPGSKARTHRGSSGQKLQALPSGYAQSKENAGPSVVKRSDGQYVKLVCLDCQRENFGSTQGFINHCRIAHRREFKSHEEAAVQSGKPIDVDEAGVIAGGEPVQNTPVATGLVHPLIRSAPSDKAAYAALLSRIDASKKLYYEGKLPGVTSIPGSAIATSPTGPSTPIAQTSTTFRPSTDTPYLSNLLRNKGFGGNLYEIVEDAKKVDDFDELSSLDEESDTERPTATTPLGVIAGLDGASDSPPPTMRMPARSSLPPPSFGRPASSKGPDGNKNGRIPGISPRLAYATPTCVATIDHNRLTTSAVNNHDQQNPEEDLDVSMLDAPSIDLSPHTSASNNAPSLVSDDGEYDEGDDDAESSIDVSEGEDEGSDVAEIDFEDDEDEKMAPRTAPRHRSGTGGEGGSMRLRKEEKHVTFVSPVKEGPKERRNKK